MNSRSRRICRKGFTLIELLVVIAIIAVLAAILFPILTGAKRTAQSRTCQSNLRQLALATSLYTDAYGGRYPVQMVDGVFDWNTPTATPNWARALEQYVKNARIPACPSSPKLASCKTNCTMPISSSSYPISYLANGKIFGTGIKESGVTRSSKTILFQCGGRTWDKCWLAPAKDEEYGEWVSYASESWCNHDEGTNLAYADSHIKWRRYEDIDKGLSQDLISKQLTAFDP